MSANNEHGAGTGTYEPMAAHNHIPVRDHIGTYDHAPVHDYAASHGHIPVHDYADVHPRESCPCEAVRELKTIVERHERELAVGSTSFALIKQDLEHIKAALEKKDRFNTGILSNIANIVLSILLGWLAVKLGISG
ncbi:MAG: hypothetical protein IJC45_08760 [Clostridia bacterium]|nr:hypothetical protein [Clostridia bacterium]